MTRGVAFGGGIQREWGSAYCDLVRDYATRTMGKNGLNAWICGDGGIWQCGYRLVMVWGKSAQYWTAFVWVYDSASFWLLCFSLSQIAICVVGMLPKRFWKAARIETICRI